MVESYRHYRLPAAGARLRVEGQHSFTTMLEATVDSEPTVDPDPPSSPLTATARAHHVIRTHVPHRDWRWLGLRLTCRHCGQRYPCPPRRRALDQLERGLPASRAHAPRPSRRGADGHAA